LSQNGQEKSTTMKKAVPLSLGKTENKIKIP